MHDKHQGLIDGLRDLADLRHDDLTIGDEAANVIERLQDERDALAMIVEKQRDALKEVRRGYSDAAENTLDLDEREWAQSYLQDIDEALSLDISNASEIIAKHDAEVLRRAAKACDDYAVANSGRGIYKCAENLRRMADELEKKA